jgi:hypothetical protein
MDLGLKGKRALVTAHAAEFDNCSASRSRRRSRP